MARIGRKAKPRGHALRPSIELTVGVVQAAMPNRNRARVARDDFLKAAVDRLVQFRGILPRSLEFHLSLNEQPALGLLAVARLKHLLHRGDKADAAVCELT